MIDGGKENISGGLKPQSRMYQGSGTQDLPGLEVRRFKCSKIMHDFISII